jgi:hypothetical protein
MLGGGNGTLARGAQGVPVHPAIDAADVAQSGLRATTTT